MYNYNNEETNKRSLLVTLIIRLLIVILIIFLLIWIFPTKGSLNPLYQDVFRNNLNSMRDAANTYFTNERLPENIGDKVKMTLGEMLDNHLLLPFVDKNNKACSLTDSYVEMTRKETEFELKVNLSCSEEEAYIIEHLGCDDKCAILGNCVPYKKEYEFMREVERKVVDGYKCASGYKLTGSMCTKEVTKTSTKDAKPIYATNTETKKPTVKYEDKVTTKDAIATYITNTLYEKPKESSKIIDVYGYKYAKEEKYYEEVNDTTRPMFQTTYDNIIGYKTVTTCDGYTYFIDNNSNAVYQYQNKTSERIETYHDVPVSTATTRYQVIGFSYEECAGSCSKKTVYKVLVTSYSGAKVIPSGTSIPSVTAKCNVKEEKVPVYGQKQTFLGYEKNQVESTRWLIKWAYTRDDKDLIKDGYAYTGVRKNLGTTEEITYVCPTGYSLNENTKNCEKKEQKFDKYVCDAGFTLEGTKCKKTEKVAVGNSCPTGFNYDKANNLCVKKGSTITGYKCDTGYTLNGKKCTKKYQATEVKDATKIYKTVYGEEYTWADTKTLAGWTATGKTRTVDNTKKSA